MGYFFISLTILLYHILPTKSIEDFYQFYQILPRLYTIIQKSFLFFHFIVRQPSHVSGEGFISVADDNGIVPIMYFLLISLYLLSKILILIFIVFSLNFCRTHSRTTSCTSHKWLVSQLNLNSSVRYISNTGVYSSKIQFENTPFIRKKYQMTPYL